MRIVIPRWVDRVIEWVAVHLFPPPRPVGVRLFGHAVTWLDVYLVAVAAVLIAGYAVYYGHWIHAVVGAGCFILAWMMIEWVF